MRKALCWCSSLMLFCSLFFVCKGCLEEERTALLQLRDSLNYPNGSVFIKEWVGYDCCEWLAVICDFYSSAQPVIEISINSRREDGLGKWYPNASLFTHFKELQQLRLVGNNIGGWIMPKALCGLNKLRILELSKNNLNDEDLPRCLAHDLSLLEELRLSDNHKVSFPLLTALCGFRNLRVLDLSYNDLSNDSLPTCLLNKQSPLETLDLSGNNLKGLPHVLTALCGARNLKVLALRNNNLGDGNLRLCPLHNLSSLESLDLSSNYIKGSSGVLAVLTGEVKTIYDHVTLSTRQEILQLYLIRWTGKPRDDIIWIAVGVFLYQKPDHVELLYVGLDTYIIERDMSPIST